MNGKCTHISHDSSILKGYSTTRRYLHYNFFIVSCHGFHTLELCMDVVKLVYFFSPFSRACCLC